MSPNLVFLHGLNSSHRSFAFMAQELGASAKIDYRSYQALDDSVVQVSKHIPKKEPVILIGHSLGGIIAMLIALGGHHNVQKIVTISAPLGGSKMAAMASWVMSGLPVLNDLAPRSQHIKRLQSEKVECPVLSIVSTVGGIHAFAEPNDGVVAVSSQKALSYAKKVEVKANHFEVLMHQKTIEHVKKFVHTEN